MIALRRAAGALGFTLLACAAALAGGMAGVWQSLDGRIYQAVYLTAAPQPDGRLRLVDIPYDNDARAGRMAGLRQDQAAALQALAGLDPPPRTVLLDIWTSSQPEGLDGLAAAVAALQKRGSRVLAAVEPKDRQGRLDGNFMQQHAQRFYTDVVDGYGHTQLEVRGGLLSFPCRLVLPQAHGSLALQALPLLVPGVTGCAQGSTVVPLGDDAAFQPLTHRLDAAGHLVPPIAPGNAPEVVIVGSLLEDSDNLLRRAGPVLLAWAVTDLSRGRDAAARRPLNNPWATLGLALGMVLATLVAYRMGFRVLRGRLAPVHWPALAAGSTVFAVAAAAVLLLASVGLAALDGGPVAPLAMPLAMGMFAAGWAWLTARSWIADAQARGDVGRTGEERAVACDVFISYAHDPAAHQAWVRDHIVGPLSALRSPQGRPLRIFFDESAIKVGRSWKSEIELALLGTRCFIPVYSPGYFDRPYCREEIELADQLRIEGRLRMFPVARSVDTVPERYLRKLQYLDARGEQDVAAELCRQVLAALAEAAGPPADAQPSETSR